VIDLSAVTLVVLGAGLAERFGSDKLAAELHGRPLSQHLLRTVSPLPFGQKLLVARGQPWADAYAVAGFTVLNNPQPELGPGASLAVAAAAADRPVLLVCLADMPYVTASHLLRLVEAHNASSKAVASISDDYRGPPAIIPRRLLETIDLVQSGARSLLNQADSVTAEPDNLRDVDTPAMLTLLSSQTT
jgi:molybdenum cofactor cytidylyltransferase